MRYSRYLTYDIFGGILWVSSMVMIGFTLGKKIPNVEKQIHWVIAGVIFLSILPGIIQAWRVHAGKDSSPAEGQTKSTQG